MDNRSPGKLAPLMHLTKRQCRRRLGALQTRLLSKEFAYALAALPLADDVDAAFLAARFFNGWGLRETALRLKLDPRTMRFREKAWLMLGKAMYDAGYVPKASRSTLAARILSKALHGRSDDPGARGGERLARVRDIDYHDADLCPQE